MRKEAVDSRRLRQRLLRAVRSHWPFLAVASALPCRLLDFIMARRELCQVLVGSGPERWRAGWTRAAE